MIPIFVRSHSTLRPLGRVLHPCALCGELTRHTLVAIETQRLVNMIVPLGEVAIAGHLATCERCELTRVVRNDVGLHHSEEAPLDELRKTTPKRLRDRAKALRALYERAADRDEDGAEARRAILAAVLDDLDDAWEILPPYDRRTKLLFAAAIATLIVGVAIGTLAGGAWLTALATTSALAATGLIAAATWAAIVGRPRAARGRIVPAIASSLAKLPFSAEDVEIVLAAARDKGSPVAIARVLRAGDLVAKELAGASPYR